MPKSVKATSYRRGETEASPLVLPVLPGFRAAILKCKGDPAAFDRWLATAEPCSTCLHNKRECLRSSTGTGRRISCDKCVKAKTRCSLHNTYLYESTRHTFYSSREDFYVALGSVRKRTKPPSSDLASFGVAWNESKRSPSPLLSSCLDGCPAWEGLQLPSLRSPPHSFKFDQSDESSPHVNSQYLPSANDGCDELLQDTWAHRGEDFASEIQAILDENGDILFAGSRQDRKKLKVVANGEIVDFKGYALAKRGKNEWNDLPPELQAVWGADWQKKAEEGHKAILAPARLNPTITVLPNPVIDVTTLVQRRFIADIGGPSTTSLPPKDKETRNNIHEMAIAFNLKIQSQDKGNGDLRYTTLAKTTRSETGVNEGKVAKIMRRGANGPGVAGFVHKSGDKRKARFAAMPRLRDGDEVGKTAPKIGESNIGFKMLVSMGWTEGDGIGVSMGGLHVPPTAVIKNTKLGLGATR